MVPILLALLLQSPPPAVRAVDLPVSLDRIRDGITRPGRFEVPPARPLRRPRFRILIEQPVILVGEAWDDASIVPPWIQPSAPPVQFDFLAAVTPEEVRSSTLHPCCDVLPLVGAISGIVSQRVQAGKQRRAKREVERAMRAAGIRPGASSERHD
jgi:hypothetical protein